MLRRLLACGLLGCALFAQQQNKKPEEAEPPEEDEALTPQVYTLNPIEAARNITKGNFYFKKGNYRAASKDYLEATKWDPTSAEAFLKLGEANEKLKNKPAAKEAYGKYLELSPDAKNAAEIKKKIAALK